MKTKKLHLEELLIIEGGGFLSCTGYYYGMYVKHGGTPGSYVEWLFQRAVARECIPLLMVGLW